MTAERLGFSLFRIVILLLLLLLLLCDDEYDDEYSGLVAMTIVMCTVSRGACMCDIVTVVLLA
jgi:hypothetical protein